MIAIAIEKGNKVGIICCSNAQKQEYSAKINHLGNILSEIGLTPVLSPCLYEKNGVFSGTGKERAKSLMDFYRDDGIKAIYDISGGDIANETLPYLDFDFIAGSEKMFWGYSDLTTIINAIYTKTGKKSVLYQIRNLLYSDSKNQIANFTDTVTKDKPALFHFSHSFLQGEQMEGIVVGGNIRCLLKLAGTGFFPEMERKILLLESFHGTVAQMVTYLSQLQQMGVFAKVNGILLGTFTQMEAENCIPPIGDLVKQFAGEKIPIAQTKEIGHGQDSKAIMIGAPLALKTAASR